jgi:hypothetical protein
MVEIHNAHNGREERHDFLFLVRRYGNGLGRESVGAMGPMENLCVRCKAWVHARGWRLTMPSNDSETQPYKSRANHFGGPCLRSRRIPTGRGSFWGHGDLAGCGDNTSVVFLFLYIRNQSGMHLPILHDDRDPHVTSEDLDTGDH